MFSIRLRNKIKAYSVIILLAGFLFPAFSFAQTFSDNFDGYGSANNLSSSSLWGVCSPTSNLNTIALYSSPKYSGIKSIQSIDYNDRYIYPIFTYPTSWTFSQRVFNKGTSARVLYYSFYSSSSCTGTVIYSLSINSSSSGVYTISFQKLSPSVNLTLSNLSIGLNTWSDIISVVETSSDIKLCYGSNCTNTTTNASGSVGRIKFDLTGVDSGNSSYYGMYIDDVSITDNSIVTAVCGSDSGQILATAPTNFCSVGALIYPSFVTTATGWTWTCAGLNGGNSANCSATMGQTSTNAVCGSDSGQILATAPTNFCSVGALIYPSFVTTATGWTWTCAGPNGGGLVHCSANMLTFTFPDPPTENDCSGLTIPNNYFCELTNLVKSYILPSSGKLNDLNQSINSIGSKAPFNYINSAQVKLAELKTNIVTSPTLAFSLLGNSGNISFDFLGSMVVGVRKLVAILFSIGFLFWAINYIKRLFI